MFYYLLDQENICHCIVNHAPESSVQYIALDIHDPSKLNMQWFEGLNKFIKPYSIYALRQKGVIQK